MPSPKSGQKSSQAPQNQTQDTSMDTTQPKVGGKRTQTEARESTTIAEASNKQKALKYKSFSTALGMKTSLLKDIKFLSDRSLQLKNTWDTLEPDMSYHFGNDDAIKITSINETNYNRVHRFGLYDFFFAECMMRL